MYTKKDKSGFSRIMLNVHLGQYMRDWFLSHMRRNLLKMQMLMYEGLDGGSGIHYSLKN